MTRNHIMIRSLINWQKCNLTACRPGHAFLSTNNALVSYKRFRTFLVFIVAFTQGDDGLKLSFNQLDFRSTDTDRIQLYSWIAIQVGLFK